MIAIFDWDGTLCDSIEQIVGAMQAAATELGLAVPDRAAVRDIVGLGLPQALARLFPDVEEGIGEQLALAYSRHYASPEQPPARLFAGAMETLQGLRERGVELAVATGKSRRGLDRVLAALGLVDFFDATRCADETRSKPHPQMVLEIMTVRGKCATETVVIGDSEYDLAMAARAGVDSVGVSFGVHGAERLALLQPLAVVDKLPDILDLPLYQR